MVGPRAPGEPHAQRAHFVKCEEIRLGDVITVRVLEVKGNQVRLGVEAPAEVRIYREEVYRAIRKENEEAAARAATNLDEVTRAWHNRHDRQ